MIEETINLQQLITGTFDEIRQAREAFSPTMTSREVGTIISVGTGIATVSGLPGVGFDELIQFPGDVLGIAFNVDENEVGVVLLGEFWNLHAGDEVTRTLSPVAPASRAGSIPRRHLLHPLPTAGTRDTLEQGTWRRITDGIADR